MSGEYLDLKDATRTYFYIVRDLYLRCAKKSYQFKKIIQSSADEDADNFRKDSCLVMNITSAKFC